MFRMGLNGDLDIVPDPEKMLDHGSGENCSCVPENIGPSFIVFYDETDMTVEPRPNTWLHMPMSDEKKGIENPIPDYESGNVVQLYDHYSGSNAVVWPTTPDKYLDLLKKQFAEDAKPLIIRRDIDTGLPVRPDYI